MSNRPDICLLLGRARAPGITTVRGPTGFPRSGGAGSGPRPAEFIPGPRTDRVRPGTPPGRTFPSGADILGGVRSRRIVSTASDPARARPLSAGGSTLFPRLAGTAGGAVGVRGAGARAPRRDIPCAREPERPPGGGRGTGPTRREGPGHPGNAPGELPLRSAGRAAEDSRRPDRRDRVRRRRPGRSRKRPRTRSRNRASRSEVGAPQLRDHRPPGLLLPSSRLAQRGIGSRSRSLPANRALPRRLPRDRHSRRRARSRADCPPRG